MYIIDRSCYPIYWLKDTTFYESFYDTTYQPWQYNFSGKIPKKLSYTNYIFLTTFLIK